MHLWKACLALLAIWSIAACNPVERANDAKDEIATFHRDYNGGEIDLIWSRVDPRFRKATTRGDFKNLMAAVRNSMGTMQETKQIGFNLNANTAGSFTVVTMQTQFEQGEAIETFTFAEADDDLKLVGYNINGEKLMSDMIAKAAKADSSATPEPIAPD